MNNVYKIPDQQSVYDEASRWIAKLDKGMTDQEQLEFQEWIVADENNYQLLFSMASLWDNMDALSRLSDIFPIEARKKSRYVYTIAASLVVFVAIAFFSYSFLWTNSNSEFIDIENSLSGEPAVEVYEIYETAVGEQSNVTLTDGSVVTLNTDSKIKIIYDDSHRKLEMERGEAHFDVEHDELRPFIVTAGHNYIRAVGTAFNVELRSTEQVEIIVTEGKILVGESIDSVAVETKESDNDLIPLSKGEIIILGDGDEKIETIGEDDINANLSWQEGKLIFQGETLEYAINEISRYTSVNFRITDEKIRHLRVAGHFKAGDVNGLLDSLKGNFKISSKRINDDLIYLSSE